MKVYNYNSNIKSTTRKTSICVISPTRKDALKFVKGFPNLKIKERLNGSREITIFNSVEELMQNQADILNDLLIQEKVYIEVEEKW